MITIQESDRAAQATQKALADFKEKFDKFQNGSIDAEEYKSARLGLGIYSQRQKGLSMIRTKIPAGIIKKESLPKIAAAADRYAGGIVHLTTRQDLQFHFVKQDDIYPLLTSLHDAGITSLGAGGNTIRNITICDHSQTFASETMNVRPAATALSDYFLGHELSKGLPRKFKITFCASPSSCGGGLVDCIAIVAADQTGGSSVPGFKIYAGGGLGAVPRLATLLEEFVAVDKIHLVIIAVLKVFNRHGTRVNRNRARLKFLIEKIGFDKFKELYQEELAKLENIKPLAITPESLTPVSTNGNGGGSVIARIPTGDISSQELIKLYDLLMKHDDIHLTTTKNADLYLGGIHQERFDEVINGIRSIGFETVTPGTSFGVTSCNGAHACNEGITNSKALATLLEKRVYESENGLKLRVSVSGCPNACGNHHTADIGMQGSAKKVNGLLVPHYQIYMGGSLKGKPRFAVPIIKIPAKRVIDAIERLTQIISKEKLHEESVRDFLERVGEEFIEKELTPFTRLDSYEENKESYLDWGSTKEFSLEDVGPGECAGSALDIIDAYFNHARHDIASARKADDSLTIARNAHKGVVQAAKALLVTYGIDPETEEELFREFTNKIITRGFMPESYRILLNIFKDEEVPPIEDSFEKLQMTELFIDDCMAAYTRINAKANVVDEGHEEIQVKRMDLSGVLCPFNYIKVKLALEGVNPGTRLEVLLDDGSPIKNVPQSLLNDGHKILSTEAVNGQFLIVVEKV